MVFSYKPRAGRSGRIPRQGKYTDEFYQKLDEYLARLDLCKALDDELAIRFEMWPDSDGPGERLYLQLKEVLQGIVRHQLPMGCKDFSDYYLLTKRSETS